MANKDKCYLLIIGANRSTSTRAPSFSYKVFQYLVDARRYVREHGIKCFNIEAFENRRAAQLAAVDMGKHDMQIRRAINNANYN